MKQKAQIDILDLPLVEGDELAKDIADIAVDSAIKSPRAKKKPGKKIYWLVLSAMIAIAGAAVAGYFLWFHGSEKKAVVPVAVTPMPGRQSYVAVLDGFNVDVKDDKGNIRLLSCGFLLEMAPHEDAKSLEGKVEIRKLIFATVHKRRVADLMRNDEKKEIKREITDGVNGLLGAGRVKETYITKFLLL